MAQGASQAFSSMGSLLKVTISATPTDVIEILSIDGPGGDTELIDVSSLASPSARREYVLGLIDDGELSFEMNHIPADSAHQYLETAHNNRTKEAFTVVASDAGAESVTFQGYVMTFQRSYRVGEQGKVRVRVKVTGAISVTP